MNLSFYIIFIDIDSFKKINDSMGHHIGDLFISDAAKRLKASIHKSDFIGRIGGDEFALIIQRRLSNKEVFKYIDKIRKHFLQPFIIEGNEITSSASFGIASFPYDGVGQVELMKNADTAMYKAKELGKNNVQFFENSMKEELLEKLNLENELKSALYNNEFFLVFQPIYNLRTGKIRGFETLVRWNSPVLGMVAPDKFIPVTEELGIIIPLGEWIIRTACKTFKKLQDKYKLEETVLAINLSVKQLESPNIVETIKYILKETNFDPNLLEIEITETTFMNSIHKTKSTLEKLQDMHISISLDDFGTGYSSLSYLRQLPIDTLKIDRTFINDILKSDRNVEIIGSIIDLSHNLDIAVIAEGIEEEIQLRHLRKLKSNEQTFKFRRFGTVYMPRNIKKNLEGISF
jgi:diguanylate cyclase (GGDEF)-like protein